MARTPKRKVFISYHDTDEDRSFKRRLVQKGKSVFVDKSVDTGDIDDTNLKVATIRQKIRDEYIRDATVTIVLIGLRTWQRRHLDWEIGGSLRKTKKNSRCGILGIVLPNHPDYGKKTRNPRLMPPRLADNCKGDDPYALIYDWPQGRAEGRLREWIQRAFARRDGTPPNNKRRSFVRDRRSDFRKGWQD